MKLIKNLADGANIYVVYGEVGSGKTSLTLSHPGHKVVFSFDASYSSLQGHEDEVTVYEPELSDYADADKFVKFIDEHTKEADLVVFDNLSALENSFVQGMTEGKIGNNTNGMAAYGAEQKFLHTLSSWALHYKGDILFTLWSKNSKKGTDLYYIPDMNDKAFNMIAGFAKLLSRTQSGFGGFEVVVNPDSRSTIKNRLRGLTKSTVKNKDFWEAVAYANGDTRKADTKNA
ncbi:AAA family ATPase [Lactobacillus acetotolerans]|uniref:AAA family ATPase n=1 Tax=Lactobacillus acetotolerans TaxID=1600 RepID=UPI002FDA6A4F